MTDEEIEKKAKLHLDEMEDSEFDFNDWSIEDSFINGGKFINDILMKNIEQLEKENKELKEQLKNNPYVIQLQNEKAEMAEDFAKQIENLEEDKGQIIFESDLKIKALEEMIEKMKNVGNCKHSMKCAKWNEKQSYLGLMKFCLNCKDWELAE